jgi:hypothetical protein
VQAREPIINKKWVRRGGDEGVFYHTQF